MARKSLVETVVDRLLDRIVVGEFPPDVALPREAELAEQSGASRLTVREAVKVLSSQQVLRTVQGRGTYVNPSKKWISLDAVVRAQGGDPQESMVQIIEVRSMIEVGAAELFAPRCSLATLATMTEDVERMREAHERSEVEDFVDGDMTFHNRILDGCGNPFVTATFSPISRALYDARVRTSSVPEIRVHAIEEHRQILSALSTGSPRATAAAMRSHLDQTINDALHYLACASVTDD